MRTLTEIASVCGVGCCNSAVATYKPSLNAREIFVCRSKKVSRKKKLSHTIAVSRSLQNPELIFKVHFGPTCSKVLFPSPKKCKFGVIQTLPLSSTHWQLEAGNRTKSNNLPGRCMLGTNFDEIVSTLAYVIYHYEIFKSNEGVVDLGTLFANISFEIKLCFSYQWRKLFPIIHLTNRNRGLVG